ncbi:hypothetical protein [Acidocella sp.]|uniref:hypothetical protein n=1 Tax=Acidocella sp. TaxID=50710 RepID=UPI00344C82F6
MPGSHSPHHERLDVPQTALDGLMVELAAARVLLVTQEIRERLDIRAPDFANRLAANERLPTAERLIVTP